MRIIIEMPQKIVQMTRGEMVTTGLMQALVGMIIVFIVLILLWGLLEIMRVTFGKANKNKQTVADNVPRTMVSPQESIQATDDNELIAVLTAAIAASLNTSSYNLNIKSYRKIGNTTPAWNSAGLTDVINSRG